MAYKDGAEALCRVLASNTMDEPGTRALRALFVNCDSIRFAMPGVPPGYVCLTSDLLMPGQLTFSLFPLEHCLGRAMSCGRPHLGRSSVDRLQPGIVDLTASNGGSAPEDSVSFCAPILPPSGTAPAIGALLLELPSLEQASQRDMGACLQLASELSLHHSQALREAESNAAAVLSPLAFGTPSADPQSTPGDWLDSSDEEGSLLGSGEELLGVHSDAGAPWVHSAASAQTGTAALELGGFHSQWNRNIVSVDRAMFASCLVMHVVSTLRYWSFFSGARNSAFVLAYGAALAAATRWSLAAPLSYARWRELTTTLLPLMAFSAPSTWELWSRKAVEDVSVWEKGPLLGAACFWTSLIFATMLPMLLLVALVQPKRFVWQWATQFLLIWVVLRQVPSICQAPLLQQPSSRHQLGQLHAVLHLLCTSLGFSSPLPTDEGVLCNAMVSTLLVMLGYVLPVGLAASWEWRAYQRFVHLHHGPPMPRGQLRSGAWRWFQGRRATTKHTCWRALICAGAWALLLGVWHICVTVYSSTLWV